MPRSQKLKKRDIDAAVYEGDGTSRDVRWDSDVPGLGLRVYPSGRKAFVFSYREPSGASKLKVLGRYGDLTVDEARDRARRHRVALADGEDPFEARRTSKTQGTFGNMLDAFIENRRARGQKSVDDTDKRLKRHIPKSWRPRLAASITRAEITGLHQKLGAKHPHEANRLVAHLSTAFNLVGKGSLNDPKTGRWFVPEGHPNPAAGIERFKEKSRSRFVRESEMPKLAAAIDREPSVYIRGFLWVAILTGLRKSELLNARRAKGDGDEPWVDWDRKVLVLPDPKSGEAQEATLPGPAVAILQALPEVEKNPYLFVGQRKGRPLVNVSKSWRAIRKAAGLEDVRLHDLRRTAGSWLSASGVDLNTIRHALRHKEIATTMVYARLGEEPQRAAVEGHAEKVLKITGKVRA